MLLSLLPGQILQQLLDTNWTPSPEIVVPIIAIKTALMLFWFLISHKIDNGCTGPTITNVLPMIPIPKPHYNTA